MVMVKYDFNEDEVPYTGVEYADELDAVEEAADARNEPDVQTARIKEVMEL